MLQKRNGNVRATSIITKTKDMIEIQRKNKILGRKMQEILHRKRSNYGELEFITARNTNNLTNISNNESKFSKSNGITFKMN